MTITETAPPQQQQRIASEPRRVNTAKRSRTAPFIIALLLVAILLGSFFYWNSRRAVTFPTPYQAVLLANGAVYYGKLEGYGTSNPVLRNVFYIVTRTDPNTRASSNILVKRGQELHGPDRMYLSPNQIVFVETVTTGSKVAELIQQANSR